MYKEYQENLFIDESDVEALKSGLEIDMMIQYSIDNPHMTFQEIQCIFEGQHQKNNSKSEGSMIINDQDQKEEEEDMKKYPSMTLLDSVQKIQEISQIQDKKQKKVNVLKNIINAFTSFVLKFEKKKMKSKNTKQNKKLMNLKQNQNEIHYFISSNESMEKQQHQSKIEEVQLLDQRLNVQQNQLTYSCQQQNILQNKNHSYRFSYESFNPRLFQANKEYSTTAIKSLHYVEENVNLSNKQEKSEEQDGQNENTANIIKDSPEKKLSHLSQNHSSMFMNTSYTDSLFYPQNIFSQEVKKIDCKRENVIEEEDYNLQKNFQIDDKLASISHQNIHNLKIEDESVHTISRNAQLVETDPLILPSIINQPASQIIPIQIQLNNLNNFGNTPTTLTSSSQFRQHDFHSLQTLQIIPNIPSSLLYLSDPNNSRQNNQSYLQQSNLQQKYFQQQQQQSYFQQQQQQLLQQNQQEELQQQQQQEQKELQQQQLNIKQENSFEIVPIQKNLLHRQVVEETIAAIYCKYSNAQKKNELNVQQSLQNVLSSFKRFMKDKIVNKANLTKLLNTQVYNKLLEYYLLTFSSIWLESCLVQDKTIHQIVIKFILQCCQDPSMINMFYSNKED